MIDTQCVLTQPTLKHRKRGLDVLVVGGGV